MSAFGNLTIVSVTGHQSFAEGALRSIISSCEKMPGSRGVLILPELLLDVPNYITQHSIKPFGYQEYSLFMVYALHNYIKTDYVITVQDDGWIIDGKNWSDDFYNYDYIGSPVHLAYIQHPEGTRWLSGFQWTPYLQENNTFITFIQNGGFSFRSKRFLQMPTALQLPFSIPAPNGLEGSPASLHWPTYEHLEDVQLCVTMRSKLESAGLRFAPLDVAKRFSIEHAGGHLHSLDDINNVFGHHSKIRKIENGSVISYQIAEQKLIEIYGELEIVNMLQNRGYEVKFSH